MKTLLCAGVLFTVAAFARADLVVEQKMESAMQNGVITFKIKGDMARIDSPSPVGGTVTTIINTKSGKMVSLMHAQKMAMVMDLATMRGRAEAAMKSSGVDPSAVKPVATGQKQKIGDWDAEEYTINVGGGTMHVWVAPKFPNGQLVKEELGKFSKAASGGALDPNSFNLPGVTVKSEMDTAAGKIVTTLQSAKEVAVPDSDFVVPDGYRTMPLPPQFAQPK
jgi:hypothetical protein